MLRLCLALTWAMNAHIGVDVGFGCLQSSRGGAGRGSEPLAWVIARDGVVVRLFVFGQGPGPGQGVMDGWMQDASRAKGRNALLGCLGGEKGDEEGNRGQNRPAAVVLDVPVVEGELDQEGGAEVDVRRRSLLGRRIPRSRRFSSAPPVPAAHCPSARFGISRHGRRDRQSKLGEVVEKLSRRVRLKVELNNGEG